MIFGLNIINAHLNRVEIKSDFSRSHMTGYTHALNILFDPHIHIIITQGQQFGTESLPINILHE